MNKKFVVFGGKGEVDKSELQRIREENERVAKSGMDKSDLEAQQQMNESETLFHVDGRIICKVDMELKNSHVFEDGTKIRRERAFNEFNRRIAQPVNAVIISGDGLPTGGDVLVSHNALHETNRVNNYKQHFEHEQSDRVRYFSIPDYECFAFREPGGEWKPLPPFEFALRIFVPYNGPLTGIEPELMKDALYVTTGELAGQVVKTGKAADYELVFQGDDGREKNLIRFRPFGDPKTGREEEALCILHKETELVKGGGYLVGISLSDAKKITDYAK